LNSHGALLSSGYNSVVNRYHVRALAAAVAGVLLALAPASADTGTTISIPVSPSPIVRLQMRSGTLIVRTWSQPQIQIQADDTVDVRHFDPPEVARALGGAILVPLTTVETKSEAIVLPPEEFPLDDVDNGPHDAVQVRGGDSGATVTVTVPASTALLAGVVGRGRIQLQDYRGGTFYTVVHAGSIELRNVGGDGYVEVARGTILMSDSAMNRLRARTAIGNIVFRNCNARQIEVSSVNGSIAYDNGTFVPGLAHFESQNGNIALGIGGGAVSIGAHSGAGKIVQELSPGADVQSAQNDLQAAVGGGGPVVTATSARGAIYLYNGSLAQHPDLRSKWPPLHRPLQQKPAHRGHI
jgi:hypothetical protein